MPSHDRSALADMHIDPRMLTSPERRTRLEQLQQLAAQVEAAHLATLIAECGATPREREVALDTPTGPRAVIFTDEVVDQLAPRLHRSPGSVANDLRVARLLHGPLPGVRASLEAGQITSGHARALCRQAGRMQPAPEGDDPAVWAAFTERCAEFERRLLPIAESSTPGRTESQAARLVARLDADAEHQRRERARTRIGVWAASEGDGLMSLTAILPSIDAARIMAAVNTHAESSAHPATPDAPATPRLSMGQHRVHALLELMGLRSPGATSDHPQGRVAHQVRTEIQVVIDAATFLGLNPDAAHLPGWVRVGTEAFSCEGSAGPSGAVDKDQLLDLLADPSVPTTLRRLITDPITGALVDRGSRSYVARADLTAWLIARDGGCRFPGCPARAERCDVDHVEDFADGGPTSVTNTGLLCRRHHNGKTHGGWRIEQPRADGSCVFVSPDGTRHQHRPPPI